MKLIVITQPHFFPEEAEAITALFDAGLEILHLRKPEAPMEAVETLLNDIPVKYHCRIVTHGHFTLVATYGLKGIHLNRRNPEPPAGYTGHISCSCHSPEEVQRRKAQCDYLFLSPIYDSISKQNYASAFSLQELEEAKAQGIIDEKVIALGGITPERLPEVKRLGFGGAALLGAVWSYRDVSARYRSLLPTAQS